ncbi:GDSL-type esterase/lipase family protein [Arcobacter sp. YIC-80]|uniref:GDSL-type esterase/lipase family protein n=1 Tax=Arcobacter sp. YIC-80 TaxID=3376683 RepID=UPI00384B31E0
MKKDIRIAFVGDSFVNGTGDPEYLGWTQRVCQYIQKNNQNIELTAYNLGVRRETSSDILKRWEDEVQARLIDGDKFIVVFSFGVNDCVTIDGKQRVDLDISVKNFQNILSKAKSKYDEVLFIMPPTINDNKVNNHIEELIKDYTKVCIDLEINYINKFNELKRNNIWKKETNQNDGAHPKSKGYSIFANLILEDEKMMILK